MTPFQKESLKLYKNKLKELESRDWNKDWPSATREAPKVCSCGKKLERPKPKPELLIDRCKQFPNGLETSTGVPWRIDCKCGICYLWWGGNTWIRTHRTSELHMFISEYGKLIKPKPILMK